MVLTRKQILAAGGAAALVPNSALAATTPKRGGTLRVAMGREFIGADPQGSSAGVDRNLYTSLYNGLVVPDAQIRIVPGLATSWSQPDPKTYVFQLRRGVKFHDGTPFDAEAVKFNFDYILDPANHSQRRPEIAMVDRVEVTSPMSVRVTLKQPFSPFLATIADRAGYMVSPTARKKYGKDLARNPVGTGPFKFVEWVRDDHMRLQRNEDYYERGLPYLDEIVYHPITDQSVVFTELRTGNIDFAYTLAIDPKDVPAVKQIKSLNVLIGPGVGYEGFWFNTAAGPLANRALREAFSLALDREQLLKIAYSGVGQIANGPLPPSLWAYDQKIPVVKRDVAQAKKKLAEGGKPAGFPLTLKAESNNPLQAKITQLAQAQLREIGIQANIVTLDFAALLNAGSRNDFDALSLGWSGRIDPDGNIEPIFEKGGAFNYGRYDNPQVDALMQRGRELQNQSERKPVYDQVVKLIEADAAYAFTYFTPTLFVKAASVHGFPMSPDALMRFTTVWLSK